MKKKKVLRLETFFDTHIYPVYQGRFLWTRNAVVLGVILPRSSIFLYITNKINPPLRRS
jgi:hypothetical protein